MYDAVEAALIAAWPDITEVGENDELESFPWDDFTPPYAAIIGSRAPADPTSPTATQSFTMPLRLAYVGEVGTAAKWRTLRGQLETLIWWFQANSLDSGQLVSIDGQAWGRDVESNMAFIAKNYAHRMAILDITVRFGYAGGLP